MILFFVFRLNIYTSKVLNLLLPLGSIGAGSFESYTTSEMLNKYIFDASLVIYLSILLLLFFFTLWHFKGVNWRFAKAVILQFCKAVREISR